MEQHMQTALEEAIEGLGAQLSDLQLLNIKLPEQFEQALTETEAVNQKIKEVTADLSKAQTVAGNKYLLI